MLTVMCVAVLLYQAGDTPLLLALGAGHRELVLLLASKGGDMMSTALQLLHMV